MPTWIVPVVVRIIHIAPERYRQHRDTHRSVARDDAIAAEIVTTVKSDGTNVIAIEIAKRIDRAIDAMLALKDANAYAAPCDTCHPSGIKKRQKYGVIVFKCRKYH